MSQKPAMYPQRESIGYGTSIKYPRQCHYDGGYSSCEPKYTKICPCCKEKYTRNTGEVDYKIIIVTFGKKKGIKNGKETIIKDNKHKELLFCSWNCKQRYIREHDLVPKTHTTFSYDEKYSYVKRGEEDLY